LPDEVAISERTIEPRKVLLIRPSALGDVCRTVPCLVSLRRAFPGAAIDWLVNEAFVPAVSSHPALTGTVPFDRGSFGKGIRKLRLSGPRSFLDALKHRGYDLVVDLQGLARSGLFSWATRASRRVGFANAREFGWLGYTERHHVDASMHTVDRMLRLLELAGVRPVLDMRLYSSEAGRAEVPASLAGKRYAVVAPTSRWEGKRWPAERFAAAIPAMFEMGLDAVAVVGSRSEREQCGPLLSLAARDGRVVDLLGATSVAGLMAVVEGAAMVLANDSAALHMAVGFDRPLVALFGPTRVELVGPFRREADVIQHLRQGDVFEHKNTLAGRAMMERISVEEVVEAVGRRLANPPSA
jgi:ADP-heptose:LPS heptosyltransferase